MSKDMKKGRKSRKLFRAIGGIDDRMIIDADAPRRKKGKTAGYRWFYGMAACVVAAVSVGVVYRMNLSGSFTEPSSSSGEPSYSSIPSSSGQSDASPSSAAPPVENLPAITPGQAYEFGGGGMGGGTTETGVDYNGVALRDFSDLTNANPWTEDAELTTLPVFHNVYASTTQYDSEFLERKNLPLIEGKRASVEEMEAVARSFADDLGLTVDAVTIEPTEEYIASIRKKVESVGETLPEEETLPTRVKLTCGVNATITTDTTLRTSIKFDIPVQLPEEYKFDYYSPYEQVEASGKYLMEKYKNLLHMEKPVLNINGEDQNLYGEVHFECEVYEGAGDLTQQILGYYFHTVSFSSNKNGDLDCIYIHQYDLSQKLGDYPIYTAQEAKEKLEKKLEGSSISEAFLNGGKVERIELVYSRLGEITLMPYYHFYIETTPESNNFAQMVIDNGHPSKACAVFIVPAVREEYLS